MTTNTNISSKEITKASSRCRKWLLRLEKYLSPLDTYTNLSNNNDSFGFIALNAGVQASASPFSLRQELINNTKLKDDNIKIYFSSLLPFSLVKLNISIESILPYIGNPIKIKISPNNSNNSYYFVYMIRVKDMWKGGSSPNNGLSLLYILPCNVDKVLNELYHLFQPPIIGADKLLLNNSESLINKDNNNEKPLLICESIKEIPGLYLIHNFISQIEHDAILEELKTSKDSNSLIVETLARRTVAHFNKRFYYGKNSVGEVGVSVNSNPSFYNWMQKRLANEDSSVNIKDYPSQVQSLMCDQLTVNFYDYDSECNNNNNNNNNNNISSFPPPGIPPHVDAHSSCGEFILVVSLGSHTVMEFTRHDRFKIKKTENTEKENIVSPIGVCVLPRSLLLMTGESRYGWVHGIAEKRFDILNDFISPQERHDRVSLTWRRAREEKHRRDNCICKELCDGD